MKQVSHWRVGKGTGAFCRHLSRTSETSRPTQVNLRPGQMPLQLLRLGFLVKNTVSGMSVSTVAAPASSVGMARWEGGQPGGDVGESGL